VLDGFAFDRIDVPARHARTIERIARLVLASRSGPRSIRSIHLVGHTDRSGTASYNFALGRKRAEAVRGLLARALEAMRPYSSSEVWIHIRDSAGPTWPVASNATDARRARNRRLEIFLSSTPEGAAGAARRRSQSPREGEFEYVPSPQRIAFENALRDNNWYDAFLNLNGLSMFEMVRSIAASDPSRSSLGP
jgi:hypothetical protein